MAIAISGLLPDAAAGQPYRVAPIVTGAAGDIRYYLDGPLPTGFSHSRVTGEIIGNPYSGTFAISGVNQFVADSQGNVASRPLSVNVVNRAGISNKPTIMTLRNPFADLIGTTYATVGTVPAQLALSGRTIVATSTPMVSGTSYSITISATNGGVTIQQTFTFTAS